MQGSFFEIDDSYARLDSAGDPLVKLNSMINWSDLSLILKPLDHKSDSVKGGRPGWSPIIIAKCLILQALYNISDDSCEYQINDRLSFKRFLGLDISQKSPDAKTLWFYRERIKNLGLDDAIFSWFNSCLDEAGYVAEEGQIIDASFVPTHKPTSKHKKQFKEEIPLTSAQNSQHDRDASFTKKGKKTYYGYKNHIKIDNKHKLIRKQEVTTAKTHGSQEFNRLIDVIEGDKIYADSAYKSAKTEADLVEKKMHPEINERAYRNKPLTAAQKSKNRVKSKVRARVEHVFGAICTSMGGMMVHTIGLARAKVKVSLKNLAYNMRRFVFLESRKSQDKCA